MRKVITIAILTTVIFAGLVYQFTFQSKSLRKSYSHSNEVVILTFHDVSSTFKTTYTITPGMFEAKIQNLVSNGYTVISLNQMVNFVHGKGTLPSKAVVITVDDGYLSMYKDIYPILKKYHLPATFFLVASYIGNNPKFITWSQAREMQASGLVTFGGHTFRSHYPAIISLSSREPATIAYILNTKNNQKETSLEFNRRMVSDSQRCQAIFFRELGHTSPYFCYPYGAFSPQLDKTLRVAGYTYFLTDIPGMVRPGQSQDHFCRLDIGVPNVTPSQMIAEIKQSSYSNHRKMPTGMIITWKNKGDYSIKYKNARLGSGHSSATKLEGYHFGNYSSKKYRNKANSFELALCSY